MFQLNRRFNHIGNANVFIRPNEVASGRVAGWLEMGDARYVWPMGFVRAQKKILRKCISYIMNVFIFLRPAKSEDKE